MNNVNVENVRLKEQIKFLTNELKEYSKYEKVDQYLQLKERYEAVQKANKELDEELGRVKGQTLIVLNRFRNLIRELDHLRNLSAGEVSK